ncbi:uncharacterized protein LOC143194473 isoform X1 [Rhynchophorus ferrugineus]|uniref:Uncharacterized protein n=1 Tax=Rhynchophorus ferrugineus TaxID=354439 RepID=A0A834IVV3_RHYFE|nr:hypothetical protein GWI33_005508 [Rhynchophorus ferrugineus]
MTKRQGSYQSNRGKKIKLEDEIWGSDIDDEALNHCFEVASQVYDQNNANTSQLNITLPSYDAFKHPNGFMSSTQANNMPNKISNNLELEMERLRSLNAEKDGEISILRSKMKEASSITQIQQQKTMSEWRNKLLLSEKEVKSIRSQLEFKNLEIANLKQHLTEVKRLTIEASASQQILTTDCSVKVKSERNTLKAPDNYKPVCNEIILESVYPLRMISMNLFDQAMPEKHTIKTTSFKLSRNTIPYLQNQQTNNEFLCKHKCVQHNEKYNVHSIYSDVILLINSDLNHLNSHQCIESITKVMYFTLIHLHDLNDYLINYCACMRTEDIRQADMNYLLKDSIEEPNSNNRSEDELGLLVGKLLDILSHLILYCTYASQYICGNGKLKESQTYKTFITEISSQNLLINKSGHFLKTLLDVIKNVGKCRKSLVACGLLISTTNLLISIGKLENMSQDSIVHRDLIYSLFKELVYVRPGMQVITKFTFLLKIYSQSEDFVKFLFSKNIRKPLESKSKGFLYYTEGSCTFCVLSLLYQDTIFRVKQLPLEICCNMISSFYNTFKFAYDIHHDNFETICSCIPQLYKLEVECVFKVLESFIEDFNRQRRNYDKWRIFLKNEMIQTVLNLINSNNYELTEKYVLLYCQFKECEQILKEVQFDITHLNTSENLVKIPENSFNIDF